MKGLIKKCIAECLGTFVLVFFACGVAAATGGSLVATALAFGLVIVAMAYSIGRISGCHINPAVSIAMLVAGKMSFKEFIAYVVSQVVGGIVGGVAIFGLAKMANVTLLGDACNYVIGGQGWNAVLPLVASILMEVVLTFVFVYVILNVTDETYTGSGKKAGLLIGLTLTLVHLLGINFTGTSVNPARSIGTAVAALLFNGTIEALTQVAVFIIAPLAGGVVAAIVFKLLHAKKEEAAKEETAAE